jgi:hypothetical protein
MLCHKNYTSDTSLMKTSTQFQSYVTAKRLYVNNIWSLLPEWWNWLSKCYSGLSQISTDEYDYSLLHIY